MRRARFSLLALSLSLPAVALCAEPGTVHGEIRNTIINALPDATLHLEGTDRRLHLDGARHYSLELPPGRHVLVASGFGYRMMRRFVTVRAGEATQVDFMMTSLVHRPYRGAVRDGVTNAGFEATFQVLKTPVPARQTQDTGLFAGFLPQGEYQVEFSAPGYYSKVVTLRVPNRELIVRMKPHDPEALSTLGPAALAGRSPDQVVRLMTRRARFPSR